MKNIFVIQLNPNRIFGLDILRALAIIFVVLGHGNSLIFEKPPKLVQFLIFDGVSIFFVLSGFLIGRILIKELSKSKINYKTILNFWIRRWFRTLPNYYLILFTLFTLNYIFNNNFSLFNYKRYFLFAQNLYYKHPYFFSEAWSLSVEEWFYLLIPLLIFFLIKIFKISIPKAIIIIVFGIIIGVTFFRFQRYSLDIIDDLTSWDRLLRKQVFTRLDSLMYGIIGAYVYIYFFNFWKKTKIVFFISGIILLITMQLNLLDFKSFGLYHCVFSFSFTSLGTLFLLPYLSLFKKGKGLFYKTITYISLISYSMYLVNLKVVKKWILSNINLEFIQTFDMNLYLGLRYMLFWSLTILLSVLIYKYFEMPMTNLRDKIVVK
ncbi:acyltransferase [uncultured Winogradskyella sp.]|uniref:acyltransferase family protein n=1 Tax=uncultured Winogradskyella sp. TaxID=395353 RepID=UPI00262852AE|nr:acyltransferase [uncultured Winogradskyella sp.]